MPKLDNLDPNLLAANPRATLAAWEKYRPLVEAAVATHPRVYVYRPLNHKASTVASRVRDAIRGCLAFDYSTTTPIEVLRSWYAEVVVKHDKEYVYIGPQDAVVTELAGESKTLDAPIVYQYTTLTLEEVVAFTVLLSTGRVAGPVIVNHPPDISLLPPRPNVEIFLRDNGTLVLM